MLEVSPKDSRGVRTSLKGSMGIKGDHAKQAYVPALGSLAM